VKCLSVLKSAGRQERRKAGRTDKYVIRFDAWLQAAGTQKNKGGSMDK
jgi:hypothetical protein